MPRSDSLVSSFLCVSLGLFILFPGGYVIAADDACSPSGEYRFLCGPDSAEDLVQVPESDYLIASGYGTQAALYLIDRKGKSWMVLYPADAPRVQQNATLYGACPGAPDPGKLVAHGLNIRPADHGRSTLYVVGHGGREAIEVFEVNATGARPTLTWTGCVMMPDGMVANSVASFADGRLVITVPLFPDRTITHAMAGEMTGAVFAWSPSDQVVRRIEGTELPYANGIEVSADEQEFFVASSGQFTVTAFSNTNPAQKLRVSEPMAIVPDNLHMGSDGRLITAGLVADYDACGNVSGPEVFSLVEFAVCPRPFIVEALDPRTLQIEDIAVGPANPIFSNITMAIEIGGELWIGTFAGDRIAYRETE